MSGDETCFMRIRFLAQIAVAKSPNMMCPHGESGFCMLRTNMSVNRERFHLECLHGEGLGKNNESYCEISTVSGGDENEEDTR